MARIFLTYPWPGNVRELENFIERLSILVDDSTIAVVDLPPKLLASAGDIQNLTPLPVLPTTLQENLFTPAQTSSSVTKDEKKSLANILNPTNTSETESVSIKAKNTNSLTSPSVSRESSGAIVLPGLSDMKHYNVGLKEFLELIEDKIITEALKQVDGVKNQASELLGIKRTTLIEKLKKRKDDV